MPKDPELRLKELAAGRPYSVQAYRFVYEALDYTLKKIGCKRHVTGRELLFGIRDLALEQFGGLATMVFEIWGVNRTADFGAIVWSLAESGLMSRSDTDALSDFEDVYDFRQTFRIDARPGDWV